MLLFCGNITVENKNKFEKLKLSSIFTILNSFLLEYMWYIFHCVFSTYFQSEKPNQLRL